MVVGVVWGRLQIHLDNPLSSSLFIVGPLCVSFHPPFIDILLYLFTDNEYPNALIWSRSRSRTRTHSHSRNGSTAISVPWIVIALCITSM